jgi:hypothetical protein
MFTPVGFFAPTAAAGFDPESYGSLYYWWDFTDSSTMTFSSGQVLSSISNKAARTSGNETLDNAVGSPTFQNATDGTYFDNSSVMQNTNTSGTGGDLDTLSNQTNATVVVISRIEALSGASSQFDDMIWGFAGTGADDLTGIISGRTSTWTNNTIVSGDNAISSTYNRQLSLRDWRGTDYFATRTYTSTGLPTNDTEFQVKVWGCDFTNNDLAGTMGINGQTLGTATVSTANAVNNTSSNRGFTVNGRSRSGAVLTARQYIQHVLIYNGLLDQTAVDNLYAGWGG